MGKLADWCAIQQAWSVDAMQRAATANAVTTENVNALVNRIALAKGLTVEGTHPCQPFDENTVAPLAAVGVLMLFGVYSFLTTRAQAVRK